MKRLAQLFNELDSNTATNAKVEALVRYFSDVPDEDKMWTIALLSGRRPPRTVNYRLLGAWAAEIAEIPEWLFAESYHVVGDFAETIALLIPENQTQSTTSRSLTEYMQVLLSLKGRSEADKKEIITKLWKELRREERFIFNKLITGGLRIGIAQKLMMRALAQYTQQDENLIAARLMGDWDPASVDFQSLVLGSMHQDDYSRPYPFYLAYALDIPPEQLGNTEDWIIERKWDGVRGQIIVREKLLYVWTRGEELVTDKFPELHFLAQVLPSGTVLDGEILAFKESPLPFQDLQKRISRKNLTKGLLNEIPVKMIVYDLLEWYGEDIRRRQLYERRQILESIFTGYPVSGILLLSTLVPVSSWESLNAERLAARNYACEGLMLKHRESTYEVGRKRGGWWKWKTDPYAVDCVMIYAQRGQGRRAGMYTDFTFAVWDKGQLVSFAKAYSGLTNDEFEEITQWVNQNTIERFGPVSIVRPVHVFELHFEGIGHSPRHKSGIAVRFPRISRWRKDKKAEEADRLEDLLGMVHRTDA